VIPPILETRSLTACSGDFRRLYGIDTMAARGETVAIIGTNADRVCCFQEGRVSPSGRPAELTREQIHLAYFGR
jgi:ABC-type branched-subunit amino acid transport system ATPase component